MRTLLRNIFITLAVLVCAGCHHADLWDDMPREIASFINQYYPNSELQAFESTAGAYYVRIDDGPGMTFDKECSWISLDGYGMPLPQQFLFDRLPSPLYRYLEETENLDAVFYCSRDALTYEVKLTTNTITYNIETETLSGTIPT